MRDVPQLSRMKFWVECNRCKHRFLIERNKNDDWWKDKIELLEGKFNIYTISYCAKCKDDKLVKFISKKEKKKPFIFREGT